MTRSNLSLLCFSTASCLALACSPDPAPDPAPARAAAPPLRAVTLVTGDRVTVDRAGHVAIDPAGGRDFRTYRRDGHQYVVPGDVMRLVASGQVDARLFDVTLLLELGYDDAARDDVPLIVTYRRGGGGSGPGALAAAGARIGRSLPVLGGAAVRASKPRARSFWSAIAGPGPRAALGDGIAKIWLDGKRKMVLDRSAAQVGAPAAWQAGLTGAGVKVAVLDSGIDPGHPDFAGRIAEARSFLDESPEPIDDVGHGTHVASILAGSGAGEGGRYRGVAPDAQLLVGKVCDPFECPDSAILAGMEWAAESGAAVVNMSLTGPDGPDVDPLEQAIDELTAAHGTLFVVAAGNLAQCGGQDLLQVGSPSTADAALSVGAVDRDDRLARFSCRGPRAGDGAVKPEITAPGVDIAAARAAGTDHGEPVDALYTRLSGTSMASPHVAGAAALLAQQHPDWRAPELKAALVGSARANPEVDVYAQGAGRLDVARAIAQSVVALPSTVQFEQAVWPHEDDAPGVREIVYRNGGAGPVRLQLSIEVRDASGAPAPAAMFAIEPAELTVPAGGEAIARLIADTRVPGPDGQFAGTVVAASEDGQSVRTPFAQDKEVESHDLEVAFVDRSGAPAADGFALLFAVDSDLTAGVISDPGASRVRLPRGSYHVDATIRARGDDGRDYAALLVQPLLLVDRDVHLEVDAREAGPVTIAVPPRSARRSLERAGYGRDMPSRFLDFGIMYLGEDDPDETFGQLYCGHMGPSVPAEEFMPIVQSIWADPGPDDGRRRFTDSPYMYSLTFQPPRGRMPTGFTRAVTDGELATVRAEYAAQAEGQYVQVIAIAAPRIPSTGSMGPALDLNLPARRTEHYTTEDMDWDIVAIETDAVHGETSELTTRPRVTFEAGRSVRVRWNGAVLGPDLGFTADPGDWAVARLGDRIGVSHPFLYSDAAGHAGSSLFESGSTRLFRDGALVDERDEPGHGIFSVPPDPAGYRVEIDSVRGGDARLSTEIHLAWSFRSGHADEEVEERLPIFTIGFAPRLDLRNRAPAGRLFALPISVSRQHGAPAAPLRSLSVQVSYDRGKTWQPAPVLCLGLVRAALLLHPDGGRASLRAIAVDENGNQVEQTILDAYHIGDGG